MTFKEIVFKNFQQKFSHYAIYLFSLVISVVLYFSFITLKYAHHLYGKQNYPIIKEGSQIGSYFLFVLIIVFILYANLLFLKRRGREFALFQTIGLSRFNIMQMIMIEQLLIFITTSILGIIIGIFGSKILLMIVLRLLGINITVSIIFSVSAIIQALILILVAYILTVGQSYLYIRRRSITELASNMTKREINHNQFTISDLILGLLGIIMIVFGYYLSTRVVEHFNGLVQPFVILICTVIGAYFFYRSTVSLIFKAIKKIRQDTVNINDVMFTAPIMYRIKKNAFSLTVMTIISAITVSVLCFAAISRGTLTNEVLLNSPHDVTLKDKDKANELAYELNNKNIKHFYNYKEVVYSKLFKDKLFEKGIAKPYEVAVTSDKYIPNVEVSKGYTDIIVPEGKVSDMMKYKKHGQTKLGTKQHSIKVKLYKEINQIYFMSDVDLGGPTLVLNDKDYQYLRNHTKAKDIVSQYGFDIKHKKDMPELQNAVKNVDKNIETRSEAASEISSLTGVLLFVTSFLGVTFLIAAGCIIYIKQIDETEDEIENYSILRKLGFTYRDMAKGLKLKVIFNFALPLVFALLHAYFASIAFMTLLGSTNQTPIFIVMTVYTAIYAIFALAAYNHSKRTIRHSI